MAKIVKEFAFQWNKKPCQLPRILRISLALKLAQNSNHSLEIYEGLSENVKARLACRTDTWTMGPLIKKATNLSLQTTKGGVDINFRVRNLRIQTIPKVSFCPKIQRYFSKYVFEFFRQNWKIFLNICFWTKVEVWNSVSK